MSGGHRGSSGRADQRLHLLLPGRDGHQHSDQIFRRLSGGSARDWRVAGRGSHRKRVEPGPKALSSAEADPAQGVLQRAFGHEECGMLSDDGQ